MVASASLAGTATAVIGQRNRNQTCQQRRGCRDLRHRADTLLPEPHTKSFPTCDHKPLSGKGRRRGLQNPPPPGSLEEKHARKPDGRPPDPERTISITPRRVPLRRTNVASVEPPHRGSGLLCRSGYDLITKRGGMHTGYAV